MTEFDRYAIYYLPDPGPFADFGAAWLGWDVQLGREAAHPELEGLPVPVAKLTATPRKYGMHATIKPPFRLAPGTTHAALDARMEDLCGRLTRLEQPGLSLCRMGGFLALLPEGDQTHLSALAAQVVMELDDFRAPPSEAEIARRLKHGLSPRQEELLHRWGYPYVMEEFNFHITMSGHLETDVADSVQATLAPQLEPLLPRPFRIDSLCLCGQREGRFYLIHRYTLSG